MSRINMVLDGCWKIVSCNKYMYKLKNVYNGYEVDLYKQSVRDIIDGKTHISKLISHRIRRKDFRFIKYE